MRPIGHPHGHVFDILAYDDITNMVVKSILVQKIAYTSNYIIIMSPEHFEIHNKELRPL